MKPVKILEKNIEIENKQFNYQFTEYKYSGIISGDNDFINAIGRECILKNKQKKLISKFRDIHHTIPILVLMYATSNGICFSLIEGECFIDVDREYVDNHIKLEYSTHEFNGAKKDIFLTNGLFHRISRKKSKEEMDHDFYYGESYYSRSIDDYILGRNEPPDDRYWRWFFVDVFKDEVVIIGDYCSILPYSALYENYSDEDISKIKPAEEIDFNELLAAASHACENLSERYYIDGEDDIPEGYEPTYTTQSQFYSLLCNKKWFIKVANNFFTKEGDSFVLDNSIEEYYNYRNNNTENFEDLF